MKRPVLTALVLTTALALIAPIAQAEPVNFGLSNGQPDSTFYPFGRSSEVVKSRAVDALTSDV